MRFPIGAMTVGDVLDRGLKLLFARLPAFYLLHLIVLSPVILYQIAMPVVVQNAADTPQSAQLSIALGGLVAIVLLVVLAPIATAATLHIVMRDYANQPTTVGQAVSFAFSRFLPLFFTGLLVGLIVGLGFIACIAPGVYFAVSYIFVSQVVVVEGKAGGDALSRSSSLISGHRGRVFGILVLINIAMMFVNFGLAIALAVVIPSQKVVPTANGLELQFDLVNHAITTLVTQLVSILFSTFQAVCATLLYLDLRIRKEGYDLEMAAAADGPPVVPPADDYR